MKSRRNEYVADNGMKKLDMNVILTKKKKKSMSNFPFIYAHIYSALDGWMKENEGKNKEERRKIF